MKANSSSGKKFCINLLEKLVNIPSAFPHEEEVMLFLERELSTLGLKPKRIDIEPGRFNLLYSIGSGSPRICLNAHADTVPVNGESTPNARIDGDTLYGLGACDDKASIAAMVTAALEIASRVDEISCGVDLLISVDEEGDAKGVKGAIDQGYKCDYAIVGEPTLLNIMRAHNGLIFMKVVTTGVAAHGSTPWQGINAIERMVNLVEEMRSAISEFDYHVDTGAASINLGAIHGGDLPNRVPERCAALIDIRLAHPTTVAETMNVIRGILDTKDWANCDTVKMGEPLDTPADSKLVKIVSESAAELGIDYQILGFRGWTEAEPFQTMLGVESIVIGPGSMKQAHSSNEFVSISQTQLAAELYVRAVEKLAVK